ncbi:Uncharacterized protein PBTT_05685 [Plasmodiophora brassicae]
MALSAIIRAAAAAARDAGALRLEVTRRQAAADRRRRDFEERRQAEEERLPALQAEEVDLDEEGAEIHVLRDDLYVLDQRADEQLAESAGQELDAPARASSSAPAGGSATPSTSSHRNHLPPSA